MSDEQWAELLPPTSTINVCKCANRALVYSLSGSKNPLFFDSSGKGDYLVPSLYAVWRFPQLLKRIYVPASVFKNISRGSDVMVPGLLSGSEVDDVRVGEYRAVYCYGNPSAVGVGIMLMSAQQLASANGKGKALTLHHFYTDALWKYGDCSVPNEGFQKDCILPLEDGVSDSQKRLSELAIENLNELVEDGGPDPSDGNAVAEEAEATSSASEEEAAVNAESGDDRPSSGVQQHPGTDAADMKELLEQVFLRVIAEVEQFPVSGDALMERMRECGPDHGRLNVSQTPYRTVDMFMKAMSRKGLVKLKGKSIVSVQHKHLDLQRNQHPAQQGDDNDVDITTEVAVSDMNHLLDRSFLLTLRYLVTTDMLPLTSSQLGELMSKSAYPDTIEIKKSSYKKFSKLLKSKAKLGFIKIKEQRNEICITSVNFNHTELAALPDAAAAPRIKAPKPKSSSLAKLHVVTLYQPSKYIAFLFEGTHKKMFTMTEAKEKLFQYCSDKGLESDCKKGHVCLDPVLANSLWRGTACPDIVSKRDLSEQFDANMTRFYAIFNSRNEQVSKFAKVAPTIDVVVEKRQGRKLITRVQNLELFGLKPSEFAAEAQKKFASASSVKPLPSSKQCPKQLEEVLIQGAVFQELNAYLSQGFGIPSHLVNVIRKDRKVKASKN